MKQIIKSMLDDDLYKISMQNYALELFPNVDVEYRFKNRGNHRFSKEFVAELQNQINLLSNLCLTDDEYKWIKKTFLFLTPGYIEYLRNFRYNPSNIEASLTLDNNLDITIRGKWVETVLFEVKLMAIVSELYFNMIDTNWSYRGQSDKAEHKISQLSRNNCRFVDMGTRRRRSFEAQEKVINAFVDYGSSMFLGTSNMYFAKKYNLGCYGSQAHEIYQAAQATNSYNHCNYYALDNWSKVFSNGEVGTALTDTVGLNAFLRDFNRKLSMLYFSVRHDSGCPFVFVDKIVEHFKQMKIDPKEKTAIFSDGLNVEKALEIARYCQDKIKCSFGIGTHFTGDFGANTPALNMVIKLWSVCHNGVVTPVVKLGDGENSGKEIGDESAIKVAKWMFYGKQL